jgi:hypothetical protein
MSDESSPWLQRLTERGLSQGYLTYAEVNDLLPVTIDAPEAIEGIVEKLKRSGDPVVPDSQPIGE